MEPEACWMCGGWGVIHPLDTGMKTHRGKSVYVWAVSRAQYQPGSITCPACNGELETEPFKSKYPGDVLPLSSGIW